jgi:hypothetical protein
MKTFVHTSVAGLLGISLLLTGCETPGQGAKNGAIIGGAVGALATGTLRGAVFGAAAGAATGALAGHINKEDRRARYEQEYPGDATYTGEPYGALPYARLTDEPGFVRSPFAGRHLIDVRGIPHGARVVDPSSDRIFINP